MPKLSLPSICRAVTMSVLFASATIAQAQDDAVAVDVHTVAREDVRPVMRFPTRLKAWEAVQIVPRVEGFLIEKAATSGDYVEQGDILYHIEKEPFELELAEAQAALEQAKARLGFAEKALRRAEALSDREVVSKHDFDKYVSDYGVALSDVSAAERKVELAQIRLGYTEIKAPVSGVISNADKALNDLVGPERGPLGQLNMTDKMRAWIFVDEKVDTDLYARELAGEEITFDITLTLANGTEYPLKGEVAAWDNEVDQKTGTRAIQMAFDNPNQFLSQGMSGTVSVIETSAEGSIAIPQNAVQQDQVGRYVLVVGDDNTLRPAYVDLVEQVGTWWLVAEGLDEGQIIVTSNLQRVGPGSLVAPN